MKYHYTIIGAGVSGMTAAIILAQKGYRTALIEKSDTTGPTIRGFTRHDVFFDTGFHYTGALGEGEPLDRLFRYVGISGKIQKIFFKGNGVDLFHCLEPPFELSCCCGLENIRMKLGEAFPREENAVTAYLQMIWDAYQRLPYINLEREMTSFAFPLGIHEESLAEVLDKLTANTMLKAVLSMYCLLHGVAPREVPITFHAGVVASYYESVHGIAGGGRRLAEAFDERLHESGVDVYCGSRAEELLLSETHHITGIRLEDGNRIECTGAIVTIHPNSLLEIVPDRTFRPAYWTNLAALEDTPSAIILFGICREPVKMLHDTNIFAFPSEETLFCVHEGILEESPLFITGAKTESTHDGAHGFIVICPMPNLSNALWSQYGTDTHASDYSLFKERITRQLRTQIEAVIPELKGNISYVECATPYTLRRFTNSPTGSLYGVKHKVGQLNPIPLTKITNLYLAGQAVTAPGILGTMMSAFLACGYIVGHETLRKELRQCA